jgi:hypothetical protein
MQSIVTDYSRTPFSRCMTLTTTTQVYLVSIRQALVEKPPKVHAYMKLYVVWGRKPFPNEVALPPSRDGMSPPSNPKITLPFNPAPQLGESSRSSNTWSERPQASSSSNVLPVEESTAMSDSGVVSVPRYIEPSRPELQQHSSGSFKRKHEDASEDQDIELE